MHDLFMSHRRRENMKVVDIHDENLSWTGKAAYDRCVVGHVLTVLQL